MYRPRIATIEMATIRSGTGLNMEISCVIHGHPEPKVTWYKDEEVLFPDERVSGILGDVLANRARIGIVDFGFKEISLDDVFIRLAAEETTTVAAVDESDGNPRAGSD